MLLLVVIEGILTSMFITEVASDSLYEYSLLLIQHETHPHVAISVATLFYRIIRSSVNVNRRVGSPLLLTGGSIHVSAIDGTVMDRVSCQNSLKAQPPNVL